MSVISLSEVECLRRAATDAALSAEAAVLIAEQSAINAIPALLEIARAAAAYMAAHDDQERVGGNRHRTVFAALDVLRQALAKVTP